MNNLSKNELRRIFLDKRNSLSCEFRKTADRIICDNLLNLLNETELIAAYYSDGKEPDLFEFVDKYMRKGKTVCFPRAGENNSDDYEIVPVNDLEKDFIIGKYGLHEPGKSLKELEIGEYEKLTWLIPGIAFSLNGARLGRGKGCYDRLLSNNKGKKIGIFYECQKTDSVPTDLHDQSLDIVVTEEDIYYMN